MNNQTFFNSYNLMMNQMQPSSTSGQTKIIERKTQTIDGISVTTIKETIKENGVTYTTERVINGTDNNIANGNNNLNNQRTENSSFGNLTSNNENRNFNSNSFNSENNGLGGFNNFFNFNEFNMFPFFPSRYRHPQSNLNTSNTTNASNTSNTNNEENHTNNTSNTNHYSSSTNSENIRNNNDLNLLFFNFAPTFILFNPEMRNKPDYSKNLEKLNVKSARKQKEHSKETQEENQKTFYSEQPCVICINEFKEGEEAYETSCKHYYHTECLKTWFKENNTCPTCRSKVE